MKNRCLAFVEVNFFFKQVADVLNLCNLCGPDIVFKMHRANSLIPYSF